MKRIVITGSNGFIGKNLVNFLLNKNFEIICLTSTKNKASTNKIKYIFCPMDNYYKLDKILDSNLDYDFFIHLAWQGTSGSERDNFKIQESNYTNSRILFEIIKKNFKFKKVISFGSPIQDEFMLYSLFNNHYFNSYGLFKTTTENTLINVFNNTSTKINWIKLIHVFGVGDNPNRFLLKTLTDLKKGNDMHFSKGEQYYDFIYIDDAIEIIYKILTKCSLNSRITLTTNKNLILKTYIEKILSTFDYKKTVFFDLPSSEIHLPITSFAESDFIIKNHKFKISFEEGIKKLYESI